MGGKDIGFLWFIWILMLPLVILCCPPMGVLWLFAPLIIWWWNFTALDRAIRKQAKQSKQLAAMNILERRQYENERLTAFQYRESWDLNEWNYLCKIESVYGVTLPTNFCGTKMKTVFRWSFINKYFPLPPSMHDEGSDYPVLENLNIYELRQVIHDCAYDSIVMENRFHTSVRFTDDVEYHIWRGLNIYLPLMPDEWDEGRNYEDVRVENDLAYRGCLWEFRKIANGRGAEIMGNRDYKYDTKRQRWVWVPRYEVPWGWNPIENAFTKLTKEKLWEL